MNEIGSYIDRAFLRTWTVPLRTIFWISLREGLPGILSKKSSVPFLTRSMSGRLVCIVRSVWIGKSQRTMKFRPSVIGSGWCSYQFFFLLSLKWLQIFQWRYWPTLSCLLLYSPSVRTEHPDIRWSLVSTLSPQNLHLGSVPFRIVFVW